MAQKKPYHLHFPYKHPTFGTNKNPKSKSAWENSVYYWWWAYLKKNQEYLISYLIMVKIASYKKDDIELKTYSCCVDLCIVVQSGKFNYLSEMLIRNI